MSALVYCIICLIYILLIRHIIELAEISLPELTTDIEANQK